MKVFSSLCFCLFVAASVVAIHFYSEAKHLQKNLKTIELDPVVLQRKLQEEPPAWMLEQIRSDLSAYPSGITKAMIDEGFSGKRIEDFNLVRFTIKEGHITVAHDEKNLSSRHFRELLGCISKLNQHVRLPDVDFVVSLEDGFEGNPGIGPAFVFAKRADVASLILIPDIKALVGYSKLREMIPEANDKHPWETKIAKSFWRGSTTGGYSTLADWDRLARAQLVLLSLAHPEAVDARFHHVAQCDPEVPLLMKAKGMVSKSVSRPDHLKYKYLVDVDGNSCSYERYFWLLLSNSVVLKQVTPNIQWYYRALEPYKHYIPVKEDLSDLLEQIEWAKNHDMEAKLIAEESTQFAQNNLGPEDTALYLYLLLQEYAKKGEEGKGG
ncbi:MAG: hypothetical protein KGQ49_00295 [Verrucomicrobia bacterium]|nr:hypothetical protein [Verrucomicrobiota bacterium]MBU6445819.1 hypothetical protein [Verrucomicrobiota bacterium]